MLVYISFRVGIKFIRFGAISMVNPPVINFHLNQNVDQLQLIRAVNKTEWMDLEMNISGGSIKNIKKSIK